MKLYVLKLLAKSNTMTEGNLIIVHDKNIYQKIMNNKRGNLGKNVKLTLNIVLFKLLWIKNLRNTVLCLRFYI